MAACTLTKASLVLNILRNVRPFSRIGCPSRPFHKNAACFSKNVKALVTRDLFKENMDNKSKETFLAAINMFYTRDVHRRGQVEFIYSALEYMEVFGVNHDIHAYKAILDVFPKGKMIATNMWQVEFMHYPKHQQCAIDLLEKMEQNGRLFPNTIVAPQNSTI